MKRNLALYLSAGFLILGCALGETQQATGSNDHHADVNQRGDHVMGFSHENATHHFRLYADGGAIEVEANEKTDTSTRDEIRMHLSHMARMFADGNFHAPMLIHDQVPPGVPALQRLRQKISYRFVETDKGGRIVITSSDPDAVKALHDFLRFQITDHQTGDSMEVIPRPS